MKNKIGLIIFIIILNLGAIQCHKDAITSIPCDGTTNCTKELRSIEVMLKDRSAQATSIDLLEIKDGNTVIRSFKNITSQTVFSIIDDIMLDKEIPKGENKTINAIGTQKGNTRFNVTYQISADCCHISYVSGPLDIIF
jgi:hypothetical protein